MKSIEIIATEHRVVWRLLECLKAFVDRSRADGELNQKTAAELLHLFEWFVEGSHQDKEERHLFPRLIKGATPTEARRLARLFQDHANERRRLIGMRLQVEGALQGNMSSLDRFAAHAQSYLRLQRGHMIEEDLFVLPLAESVLSPEDDREIVQGYKDIDARSGHLGDVGESIASLGEHFGIGPVDEDVPLHLLSWG